MRSMNIALLLMAIAVAQPAVEAPAVAPPLEASLEAAPRAETVTPDAGRAHYRLGNALYRGGRGQRDLPRAYAEMRLAASAGYPEAVAMLARMRRRLTIEQRIEAVELLAALQDPGPVAAPHADMAAAETRVAVALPPPAKPVMLAAAPSSPPAPRPNARAPRSPVMLAAVTIAPSGGWSVQLGAYRVPSNARNHWSTLSGRVATFDGRQPVYERFGRFWRLRVGQLADGAAAAALCRDVIAAGSACYAVAPKGAMRGAVRTAGLVPAARNG